MMKKWFAILTALQAFFVIGASVGIAQAETKLVSKIEPVRVLIKYENNQIVAELNEAPLIQILKEIHKKTGAEWILRDSSIAEDSLTTKLKEKTLEEVLKRMLKDYSYVLNFDFRGDVTKVIIYGANKKQPLRSSKTALESDSLPQLKEGLIGAVSSGKKSKEAVGNRVASQEVTDSAEVRDKAGIAENEDLSDEPSEQAAYVPYDLDDFQPLPEELSEERIGAAEYDEQDPAGTGAASAERQAYFEELRQQARLERAKNALNSGYANLHTMAMDELVATKDPRATSALESFANSQEASSDERSKAAQALWNHAADLEFSNPEANAALVRLANDADPSVREIAKRALTDMERYQRRHGQ